MKFDSITREFHKSILKTKKNSPHIFFGAGIIASVASTVMACRATLELEDVLDEISSEFDGLESNEEFVKARINGALKLVKLYGPTVLMEIVSIGLLSGSHVQMTKRNSALLATLVATHKGIENYREKVVEEVGEEKEELIRTNGLSGGSDWNAFTRFFNEDSINYHHDSEINREFLHFIQERANMKLRSHGVVYLNEVYEMLGFKPTKMGRHYGWIYGGDGINEIDFGLFDIDNARFINGLEQTVVLTFNVDGVVSEYI